MNTGTAVGGWESGTILHTTNGGETWISQLSNSYALRDVFFTDVNTGTAVGSNGTILRTTDGGASWESQSSGTTEWLSSVCFTNADTGTVVGGLVDAGGTTVILRTVDGGATWSIQSAAVTCGLSDVHFINGNQGTIVGGLGMGGDYHGEIFHTSDGGLTWEKQIGNYPSGFCSVIFTDAMTGTIVGANGTILHTTNGGGGITWVEENPQIDVQIPKRFNLQQNYPNPFNPSTKIRYSIPHLSNVVIKVFDILGNEIETLVNEEKQSGTYEVEFNSHSGEVRNLTSGVYFYQLRARKYVEIKKMLLLK